MMVVMMDFMVDNFVLSEVLTLGTVCHKMHMLDYSRMNS